MATLTAAGINCSNGTLDGQYTGTTASNTSYPIGSYILVTLGCAFVVANSSATLYSYTPYAVFLNSNPGGSYIVLSGTWRSRGYTIAGGTGFVLYQRVA